MKKILLTIFSLTHAILSCSDETTPAKVFKSILTPGRLATISENPKETGGFSAPRRPSRTSPGLASPSSPEMRPLDRTPVSPDETSRQQTQLTLDETSRQQIQLIRDKKGLYFLVRDRGCLEYGSFACIASSKEEIPGYLILESEYQRQLKRETNK